MACKKKQETRCVDQTEKVVPFITSENDFGQQVSWLLFGVNILNFGLFDPS